MRASQARHPRERRAARAGRRARAQSAGQSGLWSYAISGDLPIVLLQIGDAENIDLVRHMVQAHAYWRLKGLAVDLVIWNEDRGGYRQALQDQIMGLIAAGRRGARDRPPGRDLRAARRADLGRGPHPAAIGARAHHHRPPRQPRRPGRPPRTREARVPRLAPTRAHRAESAPEPPSRELILANGLGGFTPDGAEYVITRARGRDDAGAVGQRASRTRASAR
jgi:hypothetical protein